MLERQSSTIIAIPCGNELKHVHLMHRRIQARGDSRFSKLHFLIEVCGGGMAYFTYRNATL
jgi:hypothetical protein